MCECRGRGGRCGTCQTWQIAAALSGNLSCEAVPHHGGFLSVLGLIYKCIIGLLSQKNTHTIGDLSYLNSLFMGHTCLKLNTVKARRDSTALSLSELSDVARI